MEVGRFRDASPGWRLTGRRTEGPVRTRYHTQFPALTVDLLGCLWGHIQRWDFPHQERLSGLGIEVLITGDLGWKG